MFPGVVEALVNAQVDIVRNIAVAISRLFDSNGAFYWIMYFVLVVALTYFYTDVIFRQQNLAETLQRQGGFIPGIRPGQRTAEYLHGVLQRITLVGACFLGIVAVLPALVRPLAGTSEMLVTSRGC